MVPEVCSPKSDGRVLLKVFLKTLAQKGQADTHMWKAWVLLLIYAGQDLASSFWCPTGATLPTEAQGSDSYSWPCSEWKLLTSLAEQVNLFSFPIWWNFCNMPNPGCILSAMACCLIGRGGCEGLKKMTCLELNKVRVSMKTISSSYLFHSLAV